MKHCARPSCTKPPANGRRGYCRDHRNEYQRRWRKRRAKTISKAELDTALPPCESFTAGTCEANGRDPDSPYGATGYCLPCKLRHTFDIPPRGKDT